MTVKSWLAAGFLLLGFSRAHAQVELNLGGGAGRYHFHLATLESAAFEINEAHPYWDKPLNVTPFLHSINGELLIGDKFLFCASFMSQRSIFRGGGTDSSGFDESIKLKARTNIYGLFGLGYRTESGRFVFGATFDVGNFKVFVKHKKRGDASPKYELLYGKFSRQFFQTDYSFASGLTFFTNFYITDRIVMKAYYFWVAGNVDIGEASYTYWPSNFGLNLMFNVINPDKSW